MADLLTIVGMLFGCFAILIFGGMYALRESSRNYAFQFPDDPFSRGVDAQWKGKGPPPSEQEWREKRIRMTPAQIRRLHRYSVLSDADVARIMAKTDADLKAAAAVRAARRTQRGQILA